MYRLILAGALVLSSQLALADIFSFTKITNNNPEDLSGQLSVNVTEISAGQTSFVFTNNVGIPSSIVQIYFDNGTGSYISGISFGTQVGVGYGDFSPSPSNLPGGNDVSYTSVYGAFTSDYGAEPNSQGGGKSNNGINASGDSLEIIASALFGDVITGLNSGDLRIGMHVQAIGQGGGSDGYVTTGQISAVPVPAALPLMASALGLFGIARRKNR